jgi:opacity protein-like surface antigen
MHFKILQLIFVFSFFIFHSSFSQSDYREAYVVTNKGDTLSGFINYSEGSKNHEFCDFKKSLNQDAITYSPSQLKGYRFLNDKYFKSKNISLDNNNSKLRFLEVLVRGKVTLYKYKSTFYVEKNDSLFYKLSNEQIVVIRDGKKVMKYSNKHVGILSIFLSDCGSFSDKINKLKLVEKELTKLIEQYNLCSGEPSESFKEKKEWLAPSVGIVLGLNSSLIKFESFVQGGEYLTSNFDISNSIIIGASFDLKSPRLNERISLHGGISYLSSEYISYSETNATSYNLNRNDVSIELRQLKIPIGLRYTFPDKSFTPYLNLGISSTLHLKSSSLWTKEIEQNNVIETYESEAFTISNNQLGYWGGIGINKKISSKLTTSIEFRYEQTNGITVSSDLDSKIQNFQFLFYLSF